MYLNLMLSATRADSRFSLALAIAKAAHNAAAATADRVRKGSKNAKVLELVNRSGGATLKHIMKATGWRAHSVRGFLSGTLGKKMGLKIKSTKTDDGDRVYSLAN